jgi:hypothetical protein
MERCVKSGVYTSDLVARLMKEAPEDSVDLDWLLHHLRHRSFGLLLLILAIAILIPGLGVIASCLIAVPAVEMMLGRHRPEFLEETGCALSGPLEPLGDIRQRGGKRVTAFAVEGDLDVDAIKSNRFEIEWPPKGGRMRSFPEIDRAAWFDLSAAHLKILESQRQLLDRLVDRAAVSVP